METFYRVRELEWVKSKTQECWTAVTVVGIFDVHNSDDVWYCTDGKVAEQVDSPESGKAMASRWHLERLSQTLEPVEHIQSQGTLRALGCEKGGA